MKNRLLTQCRQRGFTMLELIIAMSIMVILIAVGMPNMSFFGANQRLRNVAEQVHGHLQQSRSEAIARNTKVYINFAVDGTESWEYGFSSVTSLCDLTLTNPATANACVIIVNDGDTDYDVGNGLVDSADLVLTRFTSEEFQDVKMDIDNFSSLTTQIEFDPVRGTSDSGQIDLEAANGSKLSVRVSALGRMKICTPDDSIEGYEDC